MLEKISSESLDVFVVWTPAYPGDDRDKAENAVSAVSDQRATHYWDGARKLGDRYRELLGLPEHVPTAWDVYLAFDRGVRWNETPPKPDVWMHQLTEVDRGEILNPDKLRSSVQSLLWPRDGE